jgi:hypothetical protein
LAALGLLPLVGVLGDLAMKRKWDETGAGARGLCHNQPAFSPLDKFHCESSAGM